MRVFLSEHCTCGADPAAARGPLFAEGAAMLRALAADAARVGGVEVVVTWAAGLEAFGVGGVRAVEVRAPDEGAALVELLTEDSDRVLHIAPETDDLLGGWAERCLATGGNWAGCSPGAVRACGDKVLLNAALRRAGVRAPRTQDDDPGEFLSLRAPWVQKPRDGAGGDAIVYRRRPPGRPAIRGDDGRPRDGLWYFEDWVEGTAQSVAVLDRRPLPPGKQMIDAAGDWVRLSYHGGTIPAPDVDQDAVARLVAQVYAAVPGLRGWWGIDFVLPDEPFEGSRDPVLIEVNPRLTTSYLGYRALTPDNLAERMLFPERAFPPLRWKPGTATFAKNGDVKVTP